MVNKYKDKVLSADKYALVNKETGEKEEFINGSLIERIPTHQVVFRYKSYLYLDTDRLKVLQSNGITEIDLGLLILLSGNLAFILNVCMNDDGKPYNASSIGQMINQSEQAAKRKLNRLVELGVLAHKKIIGHKELGKVYMINPYFIRRGKDFGEFLSEYFHDFIPNS